MQEAKRFENLKYELSTQQRQRQSNNYLVCNVRVSSSLYQELYNVSEAIINCLH